MDWVCSPEPSVPSPSLDSDSRESLGGSPASSKKRRSVALRPALTSGLPLAPMDLAKAVSTVRALTFTPLDTCAMSVRAASASRAPATPASAIGPQQTPLPAHFGRADSARFHR